MGMDAIQVAEARRMQNRAHKPAPSRQRHVLIEVHTNGTGVCGCCGSVSLIKNVPSVAARNRKEWRCPNSPRQKTISGDPNNKDHPRLRAGDFKLLLSAQGNKCPICKKPYNEESRKTWHVDHCHKTGRIRGVLCFSCNAGLGNFKDNITALEEAIFYLSTRVSS
jgi:hypothetical protein